MQLIIVFLDGEKIVMPLAAAKQGRIIYPGNQNADIFFKTCRLPGCS